VIEISDGAESAPSATVELDGLRLLSFDGGPLFPQTAAFSLSVPIETQAELDRTWDTLTADGGEENHCG
jgi:predicted 3-demethylubiquinone-9 3-methyltransferase (glyoxalase superfamily)